jgi:hypothetical protein
VSKLARLLEAARESLSPWAPLPDAALPRLAAALDAQDVAEILERIDALSREFDAVPEWDGDEQDAISDAQRMFARLIGLLDPSLRPGAEKGLASPLPRSRNWVALGLEAHGAAALPALAAALARETDPAARQVLADLVERLLAK